ncbi:MAG: UDP-N-acetylglucosamine--N-acetylmuramyl-(pentapeptide) pyrophosphoryl-undecaprenol N-acetylglucosamine transferase [Elusimicrobia bacterium]|nr:UDP-N-acetylglucosamine--N-acetylmuramyl-(pentapeptide) pyrophosphoryl-undecaprenol N-acetylglucosamine transferase [Elusimicrobiota bacterium]
MSAQRKIVLAVGLTGGHIYPALALAEELQEQGWSCLFVARAQSELARRLLEEGGHAVLSLDALGWPRGWRSLGRIPIFAVKQARSFFLCRRALKDWKPDAVVGFGSYVSFPVLLAAKTLGLTTIIFEPNAVMGLANRVFAPLADKIALAMPGARHSVSGPKFLFVEPPLRRRLKESMSVGPEEARRRLGLEPGLPCVLVFGGSQGAYSLNQAAIATLKTLHDEGRRFSFFHVTGSSAFERMSQAYAADGPLAGLGRCAGYFDEMGLAYRAADCVVSRAGAMTCLELLYFQKKAVLIPLAASTESHQQENARCLERLGIATIVNDDARLEAGLTEALRQALGSGRQPFPRGSREQSAESFQAATLGMIPLAKLVRGEARIDKT